jgi:hypothetical protein
MIAPHEIRTIDDVISWLREAIDVTPFGDVGINVTMHEGQVQFVTPIWQPNIKLARDYEEKPGGIDHE